MQLRIFHEVSRDGAGEAAASTQLQLWGQAGNSHRESKERNKFPSLEWMARAGSSLEQWELELSSLLQPCGSMKSPASARIQQVPHAAKVPCQMPSYETATTSVLLLFIFLNIFEKI